MRLAAALALAALPWMERRPFLALALALAALLSLPRAGRADQRPAGDGGGGSAQDECWTGGADTCAAGC